MLTPPPPPPPPKPPPKKGSYKRRSSAPQSSNNSSAPQPINVRPYWNGKVADWSKKLLLPTETGCVSSPFTAQKSWFSQKITQQTNGNYLRISSPSLKSSFTDHKESVPPGTDSNGNAAKNKKQKTREESTNNTTSQKNEEGRLDTITKNTNVSQFLSKDLASTVDGLRSIGLQYGSGQLPFAS